MNDKLPKLLPCPFCGKAPRLMDWGGKEWWVRCDCGCVRSTSSRRADAIERWNTRAISSPGLEALRKANTLFGAIRSAEGEDADHLISTIFGLADEGVEATEAALAPAAGTRGDER